MSQITRYFAGGNTANGFVSFFPFVLPPQDRKRMFFIKGGPGVGKSSFMKVIGSEMEQAGYDVEYFYCSGDPECLDAVAVPKLGVGIMDATAPHSYDPELPGARDTLISLGDFLDEKAMSPFVSEIERINAHISMSYRNCYHYLKSAAELKMVAEEVENRGIIKGELLQSEMPMITVRETILIQRYTRKLLEEYIFRDDAIQQADEPYIGTNRNLFCTAYTHMGLVSYLDALPRERTALILEHNERKIDMILRELRIQIMNSGRNTVSLYHPLRSTLLSHLYVPEDQLLFTGDMELKDSAELRNSYHASDIIQEHTLQDQNFDELISYAVTQLKSAKKAHDELESYYVKNMNFTGVSEKLNEVLTKIRREQ
ncbi:MAG: hypothetical protein Q4G60_07610 [bacterium]|nr:hypothetical protein [bacterium]